MITKYRRLNIIEIEAPAQSLAITKRILQVFPLLARWYSRIRFQILSKEMLDAIEQHLPKRGIILDVGCGYGLFTLYLAMKRPDCRFIGLELNSHRVEEARRAATRLHVTNVEFHCADLANHEFIDQPNAAYCTDLLHHLTPADGDRLLEKLFAALKPGSPIVIKDISTHPRFKLYYTFILDLLVNPKDSFYYRNQDVWRSRLIQIGFTRLYVYPLKHYMPYPHFLLVGNKPT